MVSRGIPFDHLTEKAKIKVWFICGFIICGFVQHAGSSRNWTAALQSPSEVAQKDNREGKTFQSEKLPAVHLIIYFAREVKRPEIWTWRN